MTVNTTFKVLHNLNPTLVFDFTRLYSILLYVCMYVCMVITYSKSIYQPGKVTDPARDQLNRKNELFPVRVRA